MTSGAPTNVDPSLWEQFKQWSAARKADATNFANANANLMTPANGRAQRFGLQVAGRGGQFATGLTGRTAAGLGGLGAGLMTAMSGGGVGETIGSGSGAAIGTAIAGKFMPQILAKGGPIGALAGGALALAAPTIGSMLGGGIGRGVDNSTFASAAQRGADARASQMLDPNNLGNLVDSNASRMIKGLEPYLELQRQGLLNSVDAQALGVQKVAKPLMQAQAEIAAKMMPLNVAARNSVNTNTAIGNMYNTSIAGVSGLAQQVAAGNPYNVII